MGMFEEQHEGQQGAGWTSAVHQQVAQDGQCEGFWDLFRVLV